MSADSNNSPPLRVTTTGLPYRTLSSESSSANSPVNSSPIVPSWNEETTLTKEPHVNIESISINSSPRLAPQEAVIESTQSIFFNPRSSSTSISRMAPQKEGVHGLLGFNLDNDRKATFNSCNSQPSILGVRIVQFLASIDEVKRARMLKNVNALKWIPPGGSDKPWGPTTSEIDEYRSLGYSEARRSDCHQWLVLLEKTQNGVCLEEILEGRLKHLVDHTLFLDPQTYMLYGCEWAYFIDFSWKGELEILKRGVRVAVVKFEDLTDECMRQLEKNHMEKISLR